MGHGSYIASLAAVEMVSAEGFDRKLTGGLILLPLRFPSRPQWDDVSHYIPGVDFDEQNQISDSCTLLSCLYI